MFKLQIIPFDKIQQDILESIKSEMQNTYKIRADVSAAERLPKDSYNPLRKQFLTDKILEFLSKYNTRTLGVTNKDIYAEKLNFVFGQAQLKGNVALISITRLDPMFYEKSFDKQLLTARAVKESIHEVGHMLGLNHCPNNKCVMSFSNTLADVDRKSKNLCDMCKLQLGI